MTGRPSARTRDRCLGFSSILIFIVLALASARPAMSDQWYEYYKRGEDALRNEQWQTAKDEFKNAVLANPTPRFQSKTYGMTFVNYHPYLGSGIASFHLGNYQAALAFFAQEETFDAIKSNRKDLEKLREFQGRARAAMSAESSIATVAIINQSMKEAEAAEAAGDPEAALTALGRALAFSPSEPTVVALRDRLQAEVAEKQRGRDRDARVKKLAIEGRAALEAGRFDESAALLSQALELGYSREIESLREEALSKLLKDIGKAGPPPGSTGLGTDPSAPGTQITQGPDEARLAAESSVLLEVSRLEKSGQFEEALRKLQPLLARQRSDPVVRETEARLLGAKSKLESEHDIQRTIADLFGAYFAADQAEDADLALAILYRVQALDPANSRARELIPEALDKLAIQVRDSPSLRLTNKTLEVVRERKVVFGGTVFARTHRVELRLEPSHQLNSLVTPLIGERIQNDLWEFDFSRELEFSGRGETFQIVVFDSVGRKSKVQTHRVVYSPPYWRSPATWIAVSLIATGVAAGSWSIRRRRRRKKLSRRFNPYVAGAPVLTDDLFFGREALLERILQTVHNNSILLYGERRIGKTSLQHHLKKRLEGLQDAEYCFHPVYIDLQGTPQDKFFLTLAEDIHHEFESILDAPAPGKGLPFGEVYSYQSFIRDVRNVLRVLQARTKRRVKLVLLIDEVDELNDYDPRINQKLRSLFMKSFAEDMVAVVSGVGIKKRWESEGSPWYNFFEEIEVRPFGAEDARKLIESPVRGIFQYQPGAVERIIEQSRNKPYLIQKICVALVTRAYEQKRRRITLADVEAVAPLISVEE